MAVLPLFARDSTQLATPDGKAQTAPSPSAPVVSGITFDQTGYAPGQIMTATMNYTAGTSTKTESFTGTATDNVTGLFGALSVNFAVVVADPSTTKGADTLARVWTPVSDNGSVAVFTATA